MLPTAAPLPLSVPSPIPVPGSAPRASAQGEQTAAAGLPLPAEMADPSADDFLVLLAALMQQPFTPPPPVRAESVASGTAQDATNAIGDATATFPSATEGSVEAVALDVTFSVAARLRPVPRADAARPDGPVSAQIGATMRQLFPGQPAPAVASAPPMPVPQAAAVEQGAEVADGVVAGQAAPVAITAADSAPLVPDEAEVVVVSVAGDAATAPSERGGAVAEDALAAMFDEMTRPVVAVHGRREVRAAVRQETVDAPAVTPAMPASATATPVEVMPPEVEGDVVALESAPEPSGTRPVGRRASDSGTTIAETAIAAMRPSGEGAPGDRQDAGDRDAPAPRREIEVGDTGEVTVMPSRDQAAASGTSSLPLAASTTATPAPARPAFVSHGPAEAAPPPRTEVAVPEPRGDQATVLLDSADGTDRIRVSVRGSTVHATILTESSHHEALAGRVDDLRRSLGERGFTDAQVSVRLAPAHAEPAVPQPVAGAPAAPETRVTTSARGEGRTHDDPTAHQRQHPDDTTEQRGRRRHPEEETE